jgi:hypothetical protein
MNPNEHAEIPNDLLHKKIEITYKGEKIVGLFEISHPYSIIMRVQGLRESHRGVFDRLFITEYKVIEEKKENT